MSLEQKAIIKFPQDKNQYELITAVGSTLTATMHRARYRSPTTGVDIPIGIKIFDTSKIEDVYYLTTEIHEAATGNHENTVKVECCFKFDNQLWVIMSPLSRFSLRTTIRACFPNGLPKKAVAYVLNETVKGLNYMHGKNKLHENLGAGCIFLDLKSRVRIALSSLTYEENNYPKWAMAPELISDHKRCNDKATDVWMLGLLALELFYGRIPASNFNEFTFLVSGIKEEFGASKKKGNHRRVLGSSGKLGLFSCFVARGRKIPRALGEFMAACFTRDRKKRPTTNMLLEYELLKKSFEGDKSVEKLNKAWD